MSHSPHHDLSLKFILKKIVAAVEKILPQSLPMRLGLLMGIMICLPVLALTYIVETQGRDALMQEKSAKLFGVAKFLDMTLADRATLSENEKKTLDRQQQISLLHQRITRSAEDAAGVYSGLGIGFYSRELDSIITYAPNETYGQTVGQPIKDDHPGRRVMETGEPTIAFGSQVRGNIMNAMVPVVRSGQVVGYIWANELLDDVQHQMEKLDRSVLLVIAAGLMISLFLVALLSYGFGRKVSIIKVGLQRLHYNLGASLPPMTGEIGDIARSVNAMAGALREARSLNDSILDSIEEAVITVDNDGCVTMLNPAARKITGFIPEKILHRKYQDLFIDHGDFRSLLLDTLRNGVRHVDVEIEYPASGRMLTVTASTNLLHNVDGKSIGAVVFLRDLTHQRDMQRHMERAEQLAALGELVAGMAHELRNPLTAIRGFVQYLQQGASEQERHEYMAIILKEVDSINRVIAQLLSFARPTPKHYYKVRIADLMQDVLVLVRTREVLARIDFVVLIPPEVPEIEVDGELIKQVLLNLLLNAVQAITERGCITIAVSAADSHVTIKISDSGCGISAESREKIFSPFFTTKATGTGLGLSIVQRIVTVHQGKIMIDSVVGKGTDVIIELPIHYQRLSSVDDGHRDVDQAYVV